MRYYEVVFMVHPDQSEKINHVIEHYKSIIIEDKGKIHRLEDWGRRQLSYSINTLHKAHYVLLNIEASKKTIEKLEVDFRINEYIIRSMIIRINRIVENKLSLIKTKNKEIF